MLKNIKTVLFDLDDTLITTNRIFTQEIKKAVRLIAKEKRKRFKEVKKFVDEAIINTYEKVKVNPTKSWPNTIIQIDEEYNISTELKQKLLNIFLGIYKIRPQRKRGVISILKFLKKKNLKIGLVTHASEEWTYFKLKENNLSEYFDYIEIVDTNRPKGSRDWESAMKKLNAEKETTLVVGDNINGDIASAYNIGIRKLVWIKRDGAWKVYSQGDIPKGTKIITHIFQITSILDI